ncbi:hypothetical protein KR222_001814, partial [Zaprionus bogoriensis]
DFATYLKAFALIYVLPEEEWTAENIDKLLDEGEDLFQISSESDQPEGLQPRCNYDYNNYNSLEQRIKRQFTLEGHSFTLELKPPYLGDGLRPAEIQPPHIMRNLRPVLASFFRIAHYCLLLYSAGYLLIWRRRKVYFIMDVKSRHHDDLASDKHGVAMLVCVQTIESVVHLITHLDGVRLDEKFVLRELAVVRLMTPEGHVYMRESGGRPVEYRVLSENYAYLKSNLHLSLNPEETLHSCSSIVVGVAAILAAKIDHPAAWNTHMFDHLICYAVELCRSCWAENLQSRSPMDLDSFPQQLRLGQFVVEMKLAPRVCFGEWRCGICYQNNDFEHELRNTLQCFGNALFQINNQMYALWFKDNFYYLLDPYRHKLVGPEAKEDNAPGAKWATVRMFRDLLTMLSVFHQLLSESNRQSPFFIHVVHIRNMAECPPGFALKPKHVDSECEVKSLNQKIKFAEQLSNFSKQLEDISDYEPDVDSDKPNDEKFLFLVDKSDNESDVDGNEEDEDTVDEVKKRIFRSEVLLSSILNNYTGQSKSTGGLAMCPSNLSKFAEKKSMRNSKQPISRGKKPTKFAKPLKTPAKKSNRTVSPLIKAKNAAKNPIPSVIVPSKPKTLSKSSSAPAPSNPSKPQIPPPSNPIVAVSSPSNLNIASNSGNSNSASNPCMAVTPRSNRSKRSNESFQTPNDSGSASFKSAQSVLKRSSNQPIKEAPSRPSSPVPKASPKSASNGSRIQAPPPEEPQCHLFANMLNEPYKEKEKQKQKQQEKENRTRFLKVPESLIKKGLWPSQAFSNVSTMRRVSNAFAAASRDKDADGPTDVWTDARSAGAVESKLSSEVKSIYLSTEGSPLHEKYCPEAKISCGETKICCVETKISCTETKISCLPDTAAQDEQQGEDRALICDPMKYPIYRQKPDYLAVAGSESGTIESLERLLNCAFGLSNRVLTMTPWGNYVVFRQVVGRSQDSYRYFLFQGCTCNIDRFRHLDLSYGTAGLLSFPTQRRVICYMIDSRETRSTQMVQSHGLSPCRPLEEILGR